MFSTELDKNRDAGIGYNKLNHFVKNEKIKIMIKKHEMCNNLRFRVYPT